jgi:hypothetical protein
MLTDKDRDAREHADATCNRGDDALAAALKECGGRLAARAAAERAGAKALHRHPHASRGVLCVRGLGRTLRY